MDMDETVLQTTPYFVPSRISTLRFDKIHASVKQGQVVSRGLVRRVRAATQEAWAESSASTSATSGPVSVRITVALFASYQPSKRRTCCHCLGTNQPLRNGSARHGLRTVPLKTAPPERLHSLPEAVESGENAALLETTTDAPRALHVCLRLPVPPSCCSNPSQLLTLIRFKSCPIS